MPLEIADWDDLDDAEHAELHEAIREGFEDAKAGRTIDAEQWVAELRSRAGDEEEHAERKLSHGSMIDRPSEKSIEHRRHERPAS